MSATHNQITMRTGMHKTPQRKHADAQIKSDGLGANQANQSLALSWILESEWMHITNTLHGFLESEFDTLLFRQ